MRDYADEISCLMYGSITSTTVYYKSSANNDLDIVIIKHLVAPVSDHVIRTEFESLTYTSRHTMSIIRTQPPDRPDLRIGWLKFQACLEAGLPSEYDLPNEVAINACQ